MMTENPNTRSRLEMRMLKVGDKGGRENAGLKTSFPIAPQEVRKLQNRRWMDLKFRGVNETGVIFFALVCSARREQEEILKELVEQSVTGRVAQMMDEKGVEKVDISMIHPLSRKRI